MDLMNNREFEENDREFIRGNNLNQPVPINAEINDGPSGIYEPSLFQKKNFS